MVGGPLRRTDVKFPYVSHAGPRFADIVKREELLDLKVPASPVPRGCVTKKVLIVWYAGVQKQREILHPYGEVG